MPPLYWITLIINFLGLVLAIMLGLYLVTRSPRHLVAWLTALALWSVAGLFMNILLALNPPPLVPYRPSWVRFMFPFWPASALEGSPSSWLQGWSVTPAVALWHHVTTLMRPGRLTPWRWTRILAGYVLAVLAIILQANASILFPVESGDPLYLNSLKAGALYPIFGAALVILTWTSLVNLVRSARAAPASLPRKQLWTLAAATLCTGLAGPLSIVGSGLGWPVPMVFMSLLEAIPVGLIGYGIARYSALMEGRTIGRDFLYHLILLVLVVLVYLAASGILVEVYRAPTVLLIFLPILAVLTHSLMTTTYRLMDRIFFRRETRQLRADLHRLVRLAGEEETLNESLAHTLEALCGSVRATYGLILIFEREAICQTVTYRWRNGPIDLKPAPFLVDDVAHLSPGQFPAPLEEAALLIPLYAEAEQIGALVLGRPVNGMRYADEDVESLLDPADQIAEAIYIARSKAENMARIAQLAQPQQLPAAERLVTIPVGAVEKALRNLYDYAYLADSPLAGLGLVWTRLPQGRITHIERGKIVHEMLLETLDKLRPVVAISRDPPPREWYPYLILRDAYLEEKTNRDIMLQLYISEGTFNRTRRAAIRSMARALGEMESSLPKPTNFDA